jgi:hypothetical protein
MIETHGLARPMHTTVRIAHQTADLPMYHISGLDQTPLCICSPSVASDGPQTSIPKSVGSRSAKSIRRRYRAKIEFRPRGRRSACRNDKRPDPAQQGMRFRVSCESFVYNSYHFRPIPVVTKQVVYWILSASTVIWLEGAARAMHL